MAPFAVRLLTATSVAQAWRTRDSSGIETETTELLIERRPFRPAISVHRPWRTATRTKDTSLAIASNGTAALKYTQNVLGAVHAILWVAVLAFVEVTFSESPSRAAYGLLCSWWITLYLASLLRTTWRALPVFLGILVIALVIDVIKGTSFLYHDAPPIGSARFCVVLAGLLLMWASPIVINQIASNVRDRLANTSSKQ
jgi:hypothetical protein